MIIGSLKAIRVLFVLIMTRDRLAMKLLNSDCIRAGRKWTPIVHPNGGSHYSRKRLSVNLKLEMGLVQGQSVLEKGGAVSTVVWKRQWHCNPYLFDYRFRGGTWIANFVVTRHFASSSFTADIDRIIGSNDSAINPFWRHELVRVDKPAARRLIPTLVKENPLGFAPGPTMLRKDSLFAFVCDIKQKYSDKVILVRVGEFYETWGVDAIMLVQWCGLNPMGRRAKAGCPARNIQQTLDGLVGAGLSVCVFEELDDAGTKATARRKVKPRALTQVVTPGSQTYLFEMTLCQEEVNFHESRPYMGILGTASGGYSVVEVHVDSRSVRWSERLTEEALRASIAASGPVEPLYIQNVALPLSCLPDHVVKLPDVSATPDAESFPRRIIDEVVNLLQMGVQDKSEFVILRNENVLRPRPIYLATATQIGLIRPDESIPDLVMSLLPPGEVGRSSRFLRRWLLNPPPYAIADSMAELCREVAQLRIGLPDVRPVPIGKAVALLTAQQCNAPFFRDIMACLCSFLEILNGSSYSRLVPHALAVVSFQCGLVASQNALCCSAKRIVDSIRAVVVDAQELNTSEDQWAPEQLFHASVSSDPYELIPRGFFAKSEEPFRATVAEDHPIMMPAYKSLDAAAKKFCKAVKNDFGPTYTPEITWDTINNAILLRKVPKDSMDKGIFKHPFDRNRKRMTNRWTTENVEAALADYVEASSNAASCARECLQGLCDSVTGELATVVQAAHWAILLQAIDGHVRHCTANSWVLPELQAPEDSGEGMNGHPSSMPVMKFHELIPYWLPRHKAVPNSFEMGGIYLLTAPNMGGKSTFLRSVMAAALLANCGLMVPAQNSSVPRYSSFYLRGASRDAPSEGKSSFAMEVDDVRVMLRDCTAVGGNSTEEMRPSSSLGTSLVMVDELGRGTSAIDGAGLAGALLEAMDTSNHICGVFATHLHEILSLPLVTRHVSNMRMGVEQLSPSKMKLTYKLEPGVCTDSLALHTAQMYGLPEFILERAKVLSGKLGEEEEENRMVDKQQPGQTYSLSSAADIVCRIAGVNDSYSIPAGIRPPPCLEGQSVVYVLRKGSLYYCGETDNLRTRLLQHTRSKGLVHAVAVPVNDKSHARGVEAAAIQEMLDRGFQLWASGDVANVKAISRLGPV